MMSLQVAIADDDPWMREFLCRVLSYFGHRILVAAENGRQLVAACRRTQPDLIITDLRMPELDGLDAVHEICAIQAVPSIIVSGKENAALIPQIWRKSVFGFLVKPVKMDDLPPAITLAMSRFHHDQLLRNELQQLRQRISSDQSESDRRT